MKFISLTLLVSAAACIAGATTSVRPSVSYRSQGQDLARQKVGTINHEYKADMDKMYGIFTITPEYTSSFNNNKIAKDLFGCWYLQGCNTLKILGSDVTGFDTKSLNAQWFGLAENYSGSVTFKPTIQNFNADMSLYWGMDEWVQGMFLRIQAPLTWTKWDLGANFKTITAGTTEDYYLSDAEKFFCKRGTEMTTTWTPTPLNCARFCGCSCDDNKTKTRLADIHIDLGWNALLESNYNLGLYARVVVPTGNKVKGAWLFEPVVGNGHHWELGGGVTGNYIFWRNADETKHLSFSADAEVTHLFNAEQKRVFDLKNKPLSRYIQASNNSSGYEVWAPLANLTSCSMNVNVAVQADVTGMFNFTYNNWSYDLGYNFWARTCDKFSCNSCDDSCDTRNTCSSSNSCCGQGVIKNNNVDNWIIGVKDSINAYMTTETSRLTDSMIDYDGARTKGMSNKVFANVNYAWMDREVVPFVGLGGFAEFGSNKECCSTSSTSCTTTCQPKTCSSCTNVALSQWGLWLKGGCSF